MLIMPSFQKSLIVEQFQGNYNYLESVLLYKCYTANVCIKRNPSLSFEWFDFQNRSTNIEYVLQTSLRTKIARSHDRGLDTEGSFC